MPENIAQPSPASRQPLTAEQIQLLRQLSEPLQRGDRNQVRNILLQNVDEFVGNSNNVIDGNEVELLRNLVYGDVGNVANRDEFRTIQQQLAYQLPQLGILRAPPGVGERRFEQEINNLVRNDRPNYNNVNFRRNLTSNQVNNIERGMATWRRNNVHNSFAMPSSSLRNIASNSAQSGLQALQNTNPSALQDLNGIPLDERQQQLRGLLHAFWTNDGSNIRFINMQELEAIRQWGIENYNGDMETFQRDFNELFARSIQEDTPFSIQLIARQWAQASGSSNFIGQGSENFRTFFDNLGTHLGQTLVNSGQVGLDGIIAAYHGQDEHAGFDNIVLRVVNGQVQIQRSISPHGNLHKVTYLFDGGEGNIESPGGGGFGSGSTIDNVQGATSPPRVEPRILQARFESLKQKINSSDLDQGIKQDITSFLNNFGSYIASSDLGGLTANLATLQGYLNNQSLPSDIKTEIRSFISQVQSFIRELQSKQTTEHAHSHDREYTHDAE